MSGVNSEQAEDAVDQGESGGPRYKLRLGYPSNEDLVSTAAIIKTATESLLHHPSIENTSSLFHYGPEPGDIVFRQEVCKLLNSQAAPRVADCTPDNLVLTCGASHGLHLVSTLLLSTGDTVFVEDPTYFSAIRVLRDDFRMNVVTVPTDENGVDVDALEAIFSQHLTKGSGNTKSPFSAMVYLIPTFSNPQGYCLSPERCKTIVRLARRHNVLILCDDVYGTLCFHEDDGVIPPRKLIDYDDKSDPDYTGGNLLSNGSFSKILGPGVRVGWIEASERIINLLKSSNTMFSGGAVNHYMSMVIARALQLGLCQKHLAYLKQKYGRKVKKIWSILRSNLPSSVKFTEPHGGYFIWITLPPKASSEDLLELAINKYNINFLPGKRCSAIGNFQNCLRICFAHYEEDDITAAVTMLCSAITEYLNE